MSSITIDRTMMVMISTPNHSDMTPIIKKQCALNQDGMRMTQPRHHLVPLRTHNRGELRASILKMKRRLSCRVPKKKKKKIHAGIQTWRASSKRGTSRLYRVNVGSKALLKDLLREVAKHNSNEKDTHSFTHSLTHSPTHSLTHSLIQDAEKKLILYPEKLIDYSAAALSIQSGVISHHSFTHSLTHSLTHSPTYSLTHSLVTSVEEPSREA